MLGPPRMVYAFTVCNGLFSQNVNLRCYVEFLMYIHKIVVLKYLPSQYLGQSLWEAILCAADCSVKL